MMLVDLADALRAGGCVVREEPGWRTRGHGPMVAARGVVWHHTANGSVRNMTTGYPSIRVVRDGRPGLPGPLAQLGIDRDGTVVVIAAGLCYHAGAGSGFGLPTDGANPRMIGVEVESCGVAPSDLTAGQLRAVPLVGAALARHYGFGADMNIGHREWTPRKVDLVGYPGGLPSIRHDIADRLAGGTVLPREVSVPAPSPVAPSKRTPDHLPTLARGHDEGSGWIGLAQRVLAEGGYYRGRIDADFGPTMQTAVLDAQRAASLGPDGVVGMQTWCLALLGTLGTLRRGEHRGAATVELLQNLCGYRGGDLDGDFGDGTRERVRAVQRWAGLVDDGAVGGGTRAAFARG